MLLFSNCTNVKLIEMQVNVTVNDFNLIFRKLLIMNFFKNKLLLLLIAFLCHLFTISSMCATSDIYEKCVDDLVMNTSIQYFNGNSRSFSFNGSSIPFHNTSCLISFHLVINDFEDYDYFNSKNRANELLTYYLPYNGASSTKCQTSINLNFYTAQTDKYLNFYLTKLIR